MFKLRLKKHWMIETIFLFITAISVSTSYANTPNPNCGIDGGGVPNQCPDCDAECVQCSTTFSKFTHKKDTDYTLKVYAGTASYDVTLGISCEGVTEGQVKGQKCQDRGRICFIPGADLTGECAGAKVSCTVTFKKAVQLTGGWFCSLGSIKIGADVSLKEGESWALERGYKFDERKVIINSSSSALHCPDVADEVRERCKDFNEKKFRLYNEDLQAYIAKQVTLLMHCDDPGRLTPCQENRDCGSGECLPVEGKVGKYCTWPLDKPTFEKDCRSPGAYCTGGRECVVYKCGYSLPPGGSPTGLCVDPKAKPNPLHVGATCCHLNTPKVCR